VALRPRNYHAPDGKRGGRTLPGSPESPGLVIPADQSAAASGRLQPLSPTSSASACFALARPLDPAISERVRNRRGKNFPCSPPGHDERLPPPRLQATTANRPAGPQVAIRFEGHRDSAPKAQNERPGPAAVGAEHRRWWGLLRNPATESPLPEPRRHSGQIS